VVTDGQKFMGQYQKFQIYGQKTENKIFTESFRPPHFKRETEFAKNAKTDKNRTSLIFSIAR
jgi:hypothetical protein